MNHPCKIGFVSTLPGWGGSEVLWTATAGELLAQGWQVGVNVHESKPVPKPLRTLADAGAAITSRRTNLRWVRLFGNRYLRRQYAWLDHFRPDFVLLNFDFQNRGIEWMSECRRRRIPYATLVHAGIEHIWLGDEKNRSLADGYAAAAATFFVSRRNLEFVQAMLARPLESAEVVRNNFNVSYDAAPAWPDDDGTLRLACIGRFQPAAKGQDILFDVLRQDKWRHRPVEVTLYGAGGSSATLRALREMWGLDRVTFGEFTPDIEAIWRRHHALVLPSRSEGLPLVVVEAMLCGRPCIVTDVAGNAELLTDNESGFVAAAPTATALDEAMERAWQNRANLREMGRRAAQKVREKVPRDPVDAFAERLQKLIQTT